MPPVHVMIKPVSGICNMRCGYCFFYDEMAHRTQTVMTPMSVEMLECVVKGFLDYAYERMRKMAAEIAATKSVITKF